MCQTYCLPVSGSEWTKRRVSLHGSCQKIMKCDLMVVRQGLRDALIAKYLRFICDCLFIELSRLCQWLNKVVDFLFFVSKRQQLSCASSSLLSLVEVKSNQSRNCYQWFSSTQVYLFNSSSVTENNIAKEVFYTTTEKCRPQTTKRKNTRIHPSRQVILICFVSFDGRKKHLVLDVVVALFDINRTKCFRNWQSEMFFAFENNSENFKQ